MIRVDKPAAAKPAALDKKTKGKSERERAIEFFADPANHGKPFVFKAYGADEVRAVLNALFSFKCAYCESSYGATQPVAIEHFRPKGEVTTEAGTVKPGYYWLAADWENLLPSCTDCNSERYHKLPDGSEIKYGKANLFPVAGARLLPLLPGVETAEQPLLLHPALDQPEKHLEFTDEGVVRPVLDAALQPDPKAEASIPVYGLQRPGLVQARKALALRLRRELDELSKLMGLMAQLGRQQALVELYDSKVKAIKKYREPGEPYSAMASQVIRRHLPTLGIRV